MYSTRLKVSLRRPSSTRAAVVLAVLTLCGCASQVPATIRTAPAVTVDLAQVQRDPARFTGQPVRWGGTIIAVRNHPDNTEIEVLARPLDAVGAPRAGSEGQGRFMARVGSFLDPAEFGVDRELTVVGPITGTETRPVGDYPYLYPIVRVEHRYLWPAAPPPSADVYYGPGFSPFYGPWYDPWFGSGFSPWYRPYGPYFRPPRRARHR